MGQIRPPGIVPKNSLPSESWINFSGSMHMNSIVYTQYFRHKQKKCKTHSSCATATRTWLRPLHLFHRPKISDRNFLPPQVWLRSLCFVKFYSPYNDHARLIGDVLWGTGKFRKVEVLFLEAFWADLFGLHLFAFFTFSFWAIQIDPEKKSFFHATAVLTVVVVFVVFVDGGERNTHNHGCRLC